MKSGTDFKGLMNYLTQEDKNHESLGDNMGDLPTDQQLEAMICVSDQNQRLQKKVFHGSLSLPIGERLTNDRWKEVAHDFMDHMGYSDAPYAIIKHNDRDHEHIHIIGSRVSYNGKTVSDSFSYREAVDFARITEVMLGLKEVPSPDWGKGEKNKSSKEIHAERKHAKGKGDKLVKTQIKDAVQECLKKTRGSSLKQFTVNFKKELNGRGVKMHFHSHAKSGEVYGLSYQMGDKVFKASQLGKTYQNKQMQESIKKAFISQMPEMNITIQPSTEVNTQPTVERAQDPAPTHEEGYTPKPFIGPGQKKSDDEEEDEEELRKKRKRRRGRDMN
ncbi:relaxase/mobilization nuclease domain-containing protein [Reichenbachiella sp. ABR2-5]|uniref:Relaxase/mobilization nuclease domain-containing protein n=2 Tax=Reichenbachiella ulvae TaxID=2980104 RepID=A0ABT3CVB0_9BACT|nr:relaxase/mobilization nuclease domain-containing protein [Reichenbachiella ulvae]